MQRPAACSDERAPSPCPYPSLHAHLPAPPLQSSPLPSVLSPPHRDCLRRVLPKHSPPLDPKRGAHCRFRLALTPARQERAGARSHQ
eukprot:2870908-Rhodomonas_salina.3